MMWCIISSSSLFHTTNLLTDCELTRFLLLSQRTFKTLLTNRNKCFSSRELLARLKKYIYFSYDCDENGEQNTHKNKRASEWTNERSVRTNGRRKCFKWEKERKRFYILKVTLMLTYNKQHRRNQKSTIFPSYSLDA